MDNIFVKNSWTVEIGALLDLAQRAQLKVLKWPLEIWRDKMMGLFLRSASSEIKWGWSLNSKTRSSWSQDKTISSSMRTRDYRDWYLKNVQKWTSGRTSMKVYLLIELLHLSWRSKGYSMRSKKLKKKLPKLNTSRMCRSMNSRINITLKSKTSRGQVSAVLKNMSLKSGSLSSIVRRKNMRLVTWTWRLLDSRKKLISRLESFMKKKID